MAAKVILWDFDGTLVHRPGMWGSSALESLDEHIGDHGISREEMRRALRTGFPWHNPQASHVHLNDSESWWESVLGCYDGLFSERGISPEVVTALKVSIRETILEASRYSTFDDVAPAFEMLSARGWTHVVLSNHVPELAGLIDDLGLGELFAGVITSALTGFEKPHVEAFRCAVRSSPAERYVMIGDDPDADYLGARAAGLEAILVRGSDPRCERCAPDLLAAADLVS